jgi:hypothetical protein
MKRMVHSISITGVISMHKYVYDEDGRKKEMQFLKRLHHHCPLGIRILSISDEMDNINFMVRI